MYIFVIWELGIWYFLLLYIKNKTRNPNAKTGSLKCHVSYISYCFVPEHTIMTQNFFSKPLNLILALLFYLLLFASARFCCYLVILK